MIVMPESWALLKKDAPRIENEARARPAVTLKRRTTTMFVLGKIDTARMIAMASQPGK